MKYCTHCGSELVDEAIVCPKCGCATDRRPVANGSGEWNVLSIVGFVLSFFTEIAGLIISVIARKQILKSGEKGKDLATAGIVISSVKLGISILSALICFVIFIFMLMRFPVGRL